MTVVFLKRNNYILSSNHGLPKFLAYDLDRKKCAPDTAIPQTTWTCGIFADTPNEIIRGIVAPSKIWKRRDDSPFFFVGDTSYYFGEPNLSSTLEYFDDETARFCLKDDGQVRDNITYSRKPNCGIPGLFGTSETEEELDVFHIIHCRVNS